MTVKELIANSHPEAVWKYMYDDYFVFRKYTCEKIDRLHKEIIDAIDIIKNMEISEITENDWIIVIGQYYDDLEPQDQLYMESDLFCISDILKNFHKDNMVESGHTLDEWGKDKIMDYFNKEKPNITTYGFEFSEWKEVIGYKVWHGSIEEYGTDRCISAILHEMTYCGSTPEDVKKHINEIFAETDKTIHSLDDTEYIDDTDTFKQDESEIPEYTEEDMAACLRIVYKNWCMMYKRIKKVFNEFC